jgi:hypothetical protein
LITFFLKKIHDQCCDGSPDKHGCNDRTDVRPIEIGTHACSVPDIIPDIVGNDRGVTGVMLGNSNNGLTYAIPLYGRFFIAVR